jgi:hypothetical protein
MRRKAQSLLEFSIILIVATLIAVVLVQFINKKINDTEEAQIEIEQVSEDSSLKNENISIDEKNCTQMGLSWDAQNNVCEPK